MKETQQIPREFFGALRDPDTYNPFANLYTGFGFLWGLPVPFFAVAIHLVILGDPFSVESVARCYWQSPWHYFFLAHPLLFAVIFGAMGTVRYRKDEEIRTLLRQREGQVQELARANEKLKELDAFRKDFLANVTHDLRTPLVSISGYADMLLSGRLGDVNDKQRNAANVTLRNVDSLLSMINDLLSLSRIQRRREEMATDEFGLLNVVEECYTGFRPLFHERGLSFRIQIDPDVRLRGDRKCIRRLFDNLISNAVKFTGSGGLVEVFTVEQAPHRITVGIRDTGCGIPEDLVGRLFERFWQRDLGRPRSERGVGLGLAIAREIVEAHGGSIGVSSDVGVGSEFHFDLPRIGVGISARPEGASV